MIIISGISYAQTTLSEQFRKNNHSKKKKKKKKKYFFFLAMPDDNLIHYKK